MRQENSSTSISHRRAGAPFLLFVFPSEGPKALKRNETHRFDAERKKEWNKCGIVYKTGKKRNGKADCPIATGIQINCCVRNARRESTCVCSFRTVNNERFFRFWCSAVVSVIIGVFMMSFYRFFMYEYIMSGFVWTCLRLIVGYVVCGLINFSIWIFLLCFVKCRFMILL